MWRIPTWCEGYQRDATDSEMYTHTITTCLFYLWSLNKRFSNKEQQIGTDYVDITNGCKTKVMVGFKVAIPLHTHTGSQVEEI